MQKLFLSTSDCPTGKLPAGREMEIDAQDGKLLGVTLRNPDGVAHVDPETDEQTGWDFDEAHEDCMCPVTLGNALALFNKAANVLGVALPDKEAVYPLIAPLLGKRKFSKLALFVALSKMGVWESVETWLKDQTVEGVNAYTAFMLAQELDESNPFFSTAFAAAKSLLGVTEAQAEELLSACVLVE